jgi:threonine/homoserine/homoserine lactone efflux protein
MPTDLWVFATTLIVVLLLPGPDMLLVLDSSGRHGRTRGYAVAGGLAIARTVHVTLAAAGLAALVRAWPLAFTGIRLAGAAYIVWLGVQILRSSGDALTHGEAPQAGSHAAFVRRAVLTNLLNPKALIFCSVLLPQFVNPHGWAMWRQLAVLGAVSVALGAAYDLLLATGGDRLGQAIRRNAAAQRIQRWLFGGLLVAFGARLALSRV